MMMLLTMRTVHHHPKIPTMIFLIKLGDWRRETQIIWKYRQLKIINKKKRKLAMAADSNQDTMVCFIGEVGCLGLIQHVYKRMALILKPYVIEIFLTDPCLQRTCRDFFGMVFGDPREDTQYIPHFCQELHSSDHNFKR